MSYSRWGTSCWYTYHDVQSVDGEPTLNVDCEERYPLSRLIVHRAQILSAHRNKRFNRNPLSYHGPGKPPKDRVTEDEIQELSSIFDRFIEEHFAMTANTISRVLLLMPGGPRVIVEEGVEPMTMAMYCHRKHITRMREYFGRWSPIVPAGVKIYFVAKPHQWLRDHSHGHTVSFSTQGTADPSRPLGEL